MEEMHVIDWKEAQVHIGGMAHQVREEQFK